MIGIRVKCLNVFKALVTSRSRDPTQYWLVYSKYAEISKGMSSRRSVSEKIVVVAHTNKESFMVRTGG